MTSSKLRLIHRSLCHAADALSCRLPSGTFIATITNQPPGASDCKTWTHLLHAFHWDDETPPNGKPNPKPNLEPSILEQTTQNLSTFSHFTLHHFSFNLTLIPLPFPVSLQFQGSGLDPTAASLVVKHYLSLPQYLHTQRRDRAARLYYTPWGCPSFKSSMMV